MIGKFRKNEPDRLDDQIEAVLNSMDAFTPDSDEYPAQLAYLERLKKLKDGNRREPVSWDTVANVAGTLAGILLIVAYEQKHVMISKAFGFRIKNSGTSN